MLRTPRVGRRALNAAVVSSVTVLVIGLSACGSTGPHISAGKAPTVLHLTSGQSAGGKALPAAASLDGVMRPFGDVTYVFDGTLPDLGASAGSWSFPAAAKPDPARIAVMAKALGVTGEVRSLPADQGGGWAVGPNDGSAPTFTVAADAVLSWWFSSAAASVGGGCAIAVPSGGDVATTAAPVPPDQPVQPSVAGDPPVTTAVLSESFMVPVSLICLVSRIGPRPTAECPKSLIDAALSHKCRGRKFGDPKSEI